MGSTLQNHPSDSHQNNFLSSLQAGEGEAIKALLGSWRPQASPNLWFYYIAWTQNNTWTQPKSNPIISRKLIWLNSEKIVKCLGIKWNKWLQAPSSFYLSWSIIAWYIIFLIHMYMVVGAWQASTWSVTWHSELSWWQGNYRSQRPSRKSQAFGFCRAITTTSKLADSQRRSQAFLLLGNPMICCTSLNQQIYICNQATFWELMDVGANKVMTGL